jgi:hypothetical protein
MMEWLIAGCIVAAVCRPRLGEINPLLWAPFVILLWPLAILILLVF